MSSRSSRAGAPGRRGEGSRQQFAQALRPGVGVNQQSGTAGLQQQLPAAPARHQRRAVGGHDADRHERPGARAACCALTSPHSAHSVSPYEAFSTLQPVTIVPLTPARRRRRAARSTGRRHARRPPWQRRAARSSSVSIHHPIIRYAGVGTTGPAPGLGQAFEHTRPIVSIWHQHDRRSAESFPPPMAGLAFGESLRGESRSCPGLEVRVEPPVGAGSVAAALH